MGSITIRHNFEAAHRLPALGGKCFNLHGHSWWLSAEFSGAQDPAGVIVDFAVLKSGVRKWVDSHLDHGCLLGHRDPLRQPLEAEGCKVFAFGACALTAGLAWPTVESVSALLYRVCVMVLDSIDAEGVTVERVDVQETHVNSASFVPLAER